MTAGCPFCQPIPIVAENDLAFAVRDLHPVTLGHSLILPRRHVADWFATTPEERAAIFALADAIKAELDEQFRPEGYNLGINVGEVAGQTIFHVHLHLIPRYRGDVARARGGVRGVIPHRQSY